MNVFEGLDSFISDIRHSRKSDFYRKHWKEEKDFFTLPTVSQADFVATPLSQRRYTDEKSLIKIVHSPHGPFLSEWGFPAIREERYGISSSRPMVCLADSHDALEKALWCYEHGMVPAVGEKNAAIAISVAEKYRIDSLMCDAVSLRALEPYLKSRTEPLHSISILGTAFAFEELAVFAAYAESVRLVLALPEAGAFAEAPFGKQPLFTPHPGCLIEDVDGRLVLTKLSLLATPLVRYKTDISLKVSMKEGEQCVEFSLV